MFLNNFNRRSIFFQKTFFGFKKYAEVFADRKFCIFLFFDFNLFFYILVRFGGFSLGQVLYLF